MGSQVLVGINSFRIICSGWLTFAVLILHLIFLHSHII